MMIERNKTRIGYTLLFGLAEIADGLVRLLSLGYYHTRFPLEASKREAYRTIVAQRTLREAREREFGKKFGTVKE